MENLAQDISSGVDSSHENMGEVSHFWLSPDFLPLGGEIEIDGGTGTIRVEGSCRCFSLHEVQEATDFFDDALVVGTGGYGVVFKGYINDSTVVAVKRLNAQSKQGAEEFWTEVELLSKFRHPNLVSLIGYCNENQEMILVYEYLARGTLASHLYKSSREETGQSISHGSHLKWAQRLNICLGAARGLDHLHTGTEHRVIHRDVKSTNILLDENLVAKVADFGICKVITSQTTTHVSTKVKATRGYWDPDYIYTNRVTRKSDVYAFGVVLLEALCGRPPLDGRLEEEQISLVLWAIEHIQNGKLDRIVDPSLNGDATPQSLKCFAKLANGCLNRYPKDRPTMSEVVQILENALALQEREGGSLGTITKAFKGIKLMPKGMRSWWSLPKHSFPHLISDSMTSRVNRCFSLAEIRAATNDFDDHLLIESNFCYSLYKGYMVGENPVIGIKRYDSRMFLEKYHSEIRVHSLIHHPNLASLIGFCNEKHELILVFESMSNGTLESHLHKTDKDPLPWKQRLQISIDIARGLVFLHTNLEQRFIHRDLQPSNVYLDDKWGARIAGFYYPMPIDTGFTENVCGVYGTPGYMDPEYLKSRNVTQKSDVYALGVMLLEVLCGKSSLDWQRNMDEFHLHGWACGNLKRGTIDEMIDPYLIGKVAPKCFMYFLNIALSCLVEEGFRRPSTDDILHGLESSLQLQEAWENSIQMGDELCT